MGRISIELVPRDKDTFVEEMELVREKFPSVDTLNIPDILKFDMRIPEACELSVKYFPRTIPHLRAVSENRTRPFSYKDFFIKHGIKETLVVLGDNPQIVSESECPSTSVELIRKIKREMPGIKVYGGMDPYRTTLEEELEYVKEKIDAGADGFFTQPFFDFRLMETCAEKLKDTGIFWGLAPVIRDSARNYWEKDNKVVFPPDFKSTIEWNRGFAGKVLEFIKDTDMGVYFMPITVDIVDYLDGVIN